MFEWFKLSKIAIVAVIGSIEAKRTFSMSFLKSKVKNRLWEHLEDVCTCHFRSISTFYYYDEEILLWRNKKDQIEANLPPQ